MSAKKDTLARPGLVLVLGGARSGKSAFAERLLAQIADKRTYLATAQARDDEMRDRIKTHQDRRKDGWETIEAPLDAAPMLKDVPTDHGILLDCLTLWLSNQMEAGREAAFDPLLQALADFEGPVVMVSNELGMGLVPDTPLGRSFRDAQGALNQRAAAFADLVVFVAAGLPVVLKGQLP